MLYKLLNRNIFINGYQSYSVSQSLQHNYRDTPQIYHIIFYPISFVAHFSITWENIREQEKLRLHLNDRIICHIKFKDRFCNVTK